MTAVKEFQNFFTELKAYLELEKKNIAVTTADGLSKVLSAVVTAILAIMVGSILLLLMCFTLAFVIGEMFGSQALGFAILFLCVLILAIYLWSKRNTLISEPLAKVCDDVFGTKDLDREAMHKEAKEMQENLKASFEEAISPLPKAKNRYEMVTRIFSRGMMIYEGISFGMKMMHGFRSVFHHRRK